MEIKQVNILGQNYDIKDAFARALVANEYSASSSYSEGDLCIYDDNLYKCLSSTTGSWDSSAWSSTTIVDNLGGGGGYNFDITQEEWDTIVAINNQTISGRLSLSGVTKVASYMFQSCVSLEGVDFPNCTTIGESAFQECKSLQSVSSPQCSIIEVYTFQGCSSLQSVSFPQCTSIGYNAFYNCSSLQSISFPSCTRIGSSAFVNCSSLQLVSFPSCTTIYNSAFNYCISLQSVSFPVCTTISSSAFTNCTSLQSANFPSCTTIGSYAFGYCSSLQLVSFSKCTTINAGAFYRCTSLSAIYLLTSFVCKLSSSNAFNSTPMSLSSYLGYFGSIYVPSSLITSYKTATNWIYYSNRIVGV